MTCVVGRERKLLDMHVTGVVVRERKLLDMHMTCVVNSCQGKAAGYACDLHG